MSSVIRRVRKARRIAFNSRRNVSGMRLLVLILFSLTVCTIVLCSDMIVGDTVHRKMVFHQRVKEFPIPFKKRIKSLSYSDPEKRIIKVSFTSLYMHTLLVCYLPYLLSKAVHKLQILLKSWRLLDYKHFRSERFKIPVHSH